MLAGRKGPDSQKRYVSKFKATQRSMHEKFALARCRTVNRRFGEAASGLMCVGIENQLLVWT